MSPRRAVVVVVTVLVTGLSAAVGAAASESESGGSPTMIRATDYELSVPVRDLDVAAPSQSPGAAPPRVNPLAGEADAGDRGTADRGKVPLDPLAARSGRPPGRTPAPGLVFDGTSNPTGCGTCSPPDTTGDVGPDNYVQAVNATKIAVFDKSGNPLAAPFNLSTLFTSAPCNAGNTGDPQVLYDELADRWVLAQFTLTNELCFAVSETANPLGSYNLYTFSTPEFPDYFKIGVWPTGYYVSTNETTYTAYAFDRTKMLAGDPSASGVRFPGETNLLMPADVDGADAPPANSGGLFYTFKDDVFHGGSDRLELFRLTPDFATPASSTFGLAATIPVAPFAYTVCGFFILDCIPQGGTTQKVDAVSEWPMQRLAYRRFNDHESMVGNFTVGGGAATPGAAIRWFELRDTGSGWKLHQEGTEDEGGGLNRFMGSIAMDRDGNIALGYSASSSTESPSIRFSTREATDPLGTLQSEQVMQAGGGSQTGSDRWGDYSAMSIDPAAGCDFWYTNEYYSASSPVTWKTAIGVFKMPSCPSNQFSFGKVKLNKKKGTGKLSVEVGNPGELALNGSDLKSQRAAVPSAGTYKLAVKPKGGKKKKLKKKGKVKVKAKVKFTPTDGTARTQTKPVKLKRKVKKGK